MSKYKLGELVAIYRHPESVGFINEILKGDRGCDSLYRIHWFVNPNYNRFDPYDYHREINIVRYND